MNSTSPGSFAALDDILDRVAGTRPGWCPDCAERRRQGAEIHGSDRRFRELFEQVENIAVQGYDKHRQVIFWNQASERLYGYTREEALGRQLEDLIIPPALREIVVAHVTAWANGGPAIPAEELVLCAKDGSPVPVYSSHVMLRNCAGEPEMYCLDVDLCEQKKVSAELEEYRLHLERLVDLRTCELSAAKEAAETANLVKSKFLAATSHDLRQPLLAINLFLDALSNTALDEEQRRFTRRIEQSVSSLGEILNTLLDIAKLDSGAVEPDISEVDCHELIHWIEAEFSPLFLHSSLRFKLFFPRRETVLLTDVALLKNILRNLVGNAHKYCSEGGVLVGIRRHSERALVQVWDTGIGIHSEHVGRIFDEYFQTGNAERDQAKGVGLGLSIARRQARLLGSDIACRSQPGKGSVFEISLPLRQA